jgi:nitrate/nitrite transport system substrate-binding protein
MGNKKTSFGRRDILKGATATAALMAAARESFPSGAFAQGSGPETNKVTLGFIALTDSSPLIVLPEKKPFDKYGITDANIASRQGHHARQRGAGLGLGRHRRRAHPTPAAITLGLTTPENSRLMYIRRASTPTARRSRRR